MTLLPEQTTLHPISSSKVTISGELLKRLQRAAYRLLNEPPYSEDYILHSVNHAPGTLSHFGDWSGDMSGRWVYALTAAQRITGESYPKLLSLAEKLRLCQKDDGHFGKEQPLFTTDRAQIYGNGWVLLALVEFAMNTGNEDFLNAARRLGDYYVAVQDYWFDPTERMRANEFYAMDFSNFLHAIDGLVLLYRITLASEYLGLARRMADNLLAFSEADHSHNFLSTRRGLLDLYGVTGESRYLEMAEADWARVRDFAMIPTGGVYERFKDRRRDEGCSVADWLRLNLQLWQCTKKAQYLELAERILLNHFFYNQLPNGGFSHSFIDPHLSRTSQEAVWCCSMHGTHTLAILPQYLVTHNETEVFVGLYAPCEVAVPWAESVYITVKTDFPVASNIEVRVVVTSAREFSLNLRVPAWASLTRVTLDGKAVTGEVRNGFLRIFRNWEGEAVVRMELACGLWIEAGGIPVPKSEIATGRAWLDASLFFGPLLLAHNTETIEGVSPALLLPVHGNELHVTIGNTENTAELRQQMLDRDSSPPPLYEVIGAEVWGKQESIATLLSDAAIAPRRLCPLCPVSERQGWLYRFPIILTDSSSGKAQTASGGQ